MLNNLPNNGKGRQNKLNVILQVGKNKKAEAQ